MLKKKGYHINMYTINSYLMFEYAWCTGVVDSVATGNCRALDQHDINNTYLVKERERERERGMWCCGAKDNGYYSSLSPRFVLHSPSQPLQ